MSISLLFFRSTLPLSQEDYEVMKNLFSEVGNPLVTKIYSVAWPLVNIPKVE